MNDKAKNLLVRAATGAVFVAVVLGAIFLSEPTRRITWSALLAVITAGCVWEFWKLAKMLPVRVLGIAYIAAVVWGIMWFMPTPHFAVAFFVLVWTNDVFAYLIGSAVGKHSMAPMISPKKTWEGFAGGLTGAVLVAVVFGRFWIPMAVWVWAVFGLLVALGAVCGDLAESRIKRRAGVKDSGTIFPGHGGFLDRFDAMLGAAPFAALLFFILSYIVK